MSPPESHTDVTLRFVREEIAALRTTMHDELTGVRTDLSALAVEMRLQVPKVAVLEHRVSQLEKQGDRRWALYVSLIAAAVAIGSTVLQIVTR